MKTKTFVFTTQNPRASRYLLICLIVFIMPLGISFLNPVVLIILVFGCISLGMYLFIRHSKVPEEITLFNDHFHSKVFGVVYYDDIVSAKPVTVDTGEGLKLKLADGKKVWWKALIVSEKGAYESFLAALSEAVDHLNVSSRRDLTGESGPEPGRSSMAEREPETGEESASLGLELKNVQNKNKNSGNARAFLLVLTGVLLALYGIFQIFGSRWEQGRNERIMTPIQKSVMDNLNEGSALKDSAHKVIRQYARDEGPYYLYSNDSTAKVIYLPRLQITSNLPQTGVVSLVQDKGLSDRLKVFLAHPDSVLWDVSVMNGYTTFRLLSDLLGESFHKDSAATYLYFGVMNLVPDTLNHEVAFASRPGINYRVAYLDGSAVELGTEGSLNTRIQTGVKSFLRFVKAHPETARFYVAAREGEGKMDRELFDKVIAVVREGMTHYEIDPGSYFIKEFEE